MEKAAKATFSCYSCKAFFCEAASGLLLFQRIANFDFRLFTQVTHQRFKDDLCVVLGMGNSLVERNLAVLTL